MKTVNASSNNWKNECLKLAQASESFMVDSFQETNLVFIGNLCSFFDYNKLSTGSTIYLEPNRNNHVVIIPALCPRPEGGRK